MQLRATHPALQSGEFAMMQDDLPDSGVAVYERRDGDALVVVAANFGRRAQKVTERPPHGGSWRNVLERETSSPPDGGIDGDAEAGQVAVLGHDLELDLPAEHNPRKPPAWISAPCPWP